VFAENSNREGTTTKEEELSECDDLCCDFRRGAAARRRERELTELVGSLREGLLALAVGAGLQVMEAIIDDGVTALAGPKGRHDPNRNAKPREFLTPPRGGWNGCVPRRGSLAAKPADSTDHARGLFLMSSPSRPCAKVFVPRRGCAAVVVDNALGSIN
jgi:hypothetical protein